MVCAIQHFVYLENLLSCDLYRLLSSLVALMLSLSVSLSACLSACLSVCLSACLSASASVALSLTSCLRLTDSLPPDYLLWLEHQRASGRPALPDRTAAPVGHGGACTHADECLLAHTFETH
jgi:hypothetical protein